MDYYLAHDFADESAIDCSVMGTTIPTQETSASTEPLPTVDVAEFMVLDESVITLPSINMSTDAEL
jgi:hypothetical protein